MSRRLVFAVLSLATLPLLIVACGTPSEPPAGEAVAPAAEPTADLSAHMALHFDRMQEIQDAVIRGDLVAIKAPAQWLIEHTESTTLPVGSEGYLEEMRNAGQALARAASVENAAIMAAQALLTCGNCHAANNIVATLPMPTALPADAATAAGHMRQHQYAVELMYQGLVSPSEDLWNKGAEILRAAALTAQELPQVSQDVVAAEERVHLLANRAVDAPDTNAKVAIYGELIGGCASCHGQHGSVWGPGLP